MGRGGMATVFEAWDVRHERRVALKVLHPELTVALGRERFLREIRLVAGLQHPNIIAVHDSGEAGGLLFYVMPLIEGETLRRRLVRERRLAVDEATHRHAGGRGRPGLRPRPGHRAPGGEAREHPPLPERTRRRGGLRDRVGGAPRSGRAPDRHGGEPRDARLHGTRAGPGRGGRPPFGREPVQALARAVTGAAPSVLERRPDVPPQILGVVRRALAARPDRFPSAVELAAALAPDAHGPAVVNGRTLSATGRRGRWTRATGLTAAALGAVALVAASWAMATRRDATHEGGTVRVSTDSVANELYRQASSSPPVGPFPFTPNGAAGSEPARTRQSRGRKAGLVPMEHRCSHQSCLSTDEATSRRQSRRGGTPAASTEPRSPRLRRFLLSRRFRALRRAGLSLGAPARNRCTGGQESRSRPLQGAPRRAGRSHPPPPGESPRLPACATVRTDPLSVHGSAIPSPASSSLYGDATAWVAPRRRRVRRRLVVPRPGARHLLPASGASFRGGEGGHRFLLRRPPGSRGGGMGSSGPFGVPPISVLPSISKGGAEPRVCRGPRRQAAGERSRASATALSTAATRDRASPGARPGGRGALGLQRTEIAGFGRGRPERNVGGGAPLRERHR